VHIIISDASSNQTAFTYDAFGRVTRTNFPSSLSEMKQSEFRSGAIGLHSLVISSKAGVRLESGEEQKRVKMGEE
jgi:YD repeat-containing protein